VEAERNRLLNGVEDKDLVIVSEFKKVEIV
jgi:hypothetical protein